MIVSTVRVSRVTLPLARPIFYCTELLREWDSVFLYLESSGGVGIAEASLLSLPDWDMGNLASLLEREIAPRLKGKSLENPEAIQRVLGRFARCRPVAGLVDVAWWNLNAAEKNVPLYKALGAEHVSQPIFTSLDQPLPDAEGNLCVDDFLERAQRLFQSGVVHLELKVRPGWDIAMARFFRQENPDASFHLDIEGGMAEEQMDILLQFRDFFPRMIEQPFAPEAFLTHGVLQGMLSCPVCLDESIVSLGSAQCASLMKSAQCLKINPIRVGGLSEAKKLVEWCREHDLEAWISSPLQSGVGMNTAFALGCLGGVAGPFEYYDWNDYFHEEDVEKLRELAPPLEPILDEEGVLRCE
ncbi:MAG: enolase C-terminal domain-like protein [Planctomycetia bacterium]|nr:enolase C-terminal domain-like protein [Planctomycetia bacterium]